MMRPRLSKLFVAIGVAAAFAGASNAQAPSTSASPGGALASELSRFPDSWSRHPGGGIVDRKSGLICEEAVAGFSIEAVATAKDGGLCMWKRGDAARIIIGTKDRNDDTLEEAIETALTVIGGGALPPGTLTEPTTFNGCPALTALTTLNGLEAHFLIAQRGAHMWVTVTAAPVTEEPGKALEEPVEARRAHLNKQLTCETPG